MKQIMVFTAIIGLFIPSIGFTGQYADQINAQLAFIHLAHVSSGWEETHDTMFGKLNNRESGSFSFNLRKGLQYKIVSVCDEDCGDLDLVLYDESGHQIDEDTTPDSMPIVEARPRWTGKFRLKVRMYECSQNPCFYAFNIFGR